MQITKIVAYTKTHTDMQGLTHKDRQSSIKDDNLIIITNIMEDIFFLYFGVGVYLLNMG